MTNRNSAIKWVDDFPKIVAGVTEELTREGYTVDAVHVQSELMRVAFTITNEEGLTLHLNIDPTKVTEVDQKYVSVQNSPTLLREKRGCMQRGRG